MFRSCHGVNHELGSHRDEQAMMNYNDDGLMTFNIVKN